MPDAFLRRVIALREYQQELAVLEASLDVFAPTPCRICGKPVRSHVGRERKGERRTVCTACGGRQIQRRLELEDRRRRRAAELKSNLLAMAGIQLEESMADEKKERYCAKCGKKLRPQNAHDTCFACRSKAELADGEPAANGSNGARAGRIKPDARRRFLQLTRLLGIDGHRLIDQFCQGYLERLQERASLAAPKEEDDDDYKLPMERES